MEKREENLCSVRLSRLCRGAFLYHRDSILFLMMDRSSWELAKDRAEVAHRICRFVAFGFRCLDYYRWMVDLHGSYIIWEVCCC